MNNDASNQIYKINAHLLNLNDSFIQIDLESHQKMQQQQKYQHEINNNNNNNTHNHANTNGSNIMLNMTNNNKKAAKQSNGQSTNGFLNKYPRVRQNSMSKSHINFVLSPNIKLLKGKTTQK